MLFIGSRLLIVMKYFTPITKKDLMPCFVSCPKPDAVELEKYVQVSKISQLLSTERSQDVYVSYTDVYPTYISHS